MYGDWKTGDEVRFIDRMGIYGKGFTVENNTKERYWTLLQGYREGMDQRVNWGEINPDLVKEHVDKLVRAGPEDAFALRGINIKKGKESSLDLDKIVLL